MKVSKRIVSGSNMAFKAYSSIYDNTNNLMVYGLFAALLGIPVIVYLVNFILMNATSLSFLSTEHIAFLKNPTIMSSWMVKIVGVIIIGLIIMPFVGFFYSGVVKTVSGKKKLKFLEIFSMGFGGFKHITFWILSWFIGMLAVLMLAIPAVNWRDPRTYSLEFGIMSFVCLLVCFSAVAYLIYASNIAESIIRGSKIILNQFIEIIFGSFVWAVVAMAIFSVLDTIFFMLIKEVMRMGNPVLLAGNLIMVIFPGLWLVIAGTAWLIFVTDVCKAAKK